MKIVSTASRLVLALVMVLSLGAGLVAVQPAAPVEASSHRCIDHTYRRSSTYKTCVKYIQTMLNSLRLHTYDGTISFNLSVDGYFGYYTDRAVRSFQRHQRIGIDGIVGPTTWGRLCMPRDATVPNWEYSAFATSARAAGCSRWLQ